MTGVIAIACIALFSLDKDMHAASDFLKPLNIAAFIIYVAPTLLLSFLLFKYFSKTHDRKKSTMLSLVIGIPLSFALVISLLILSKH
jgi:integral membrane sensor domain MASE1